MSKRKVRQFLVTVEEVTLDPLNIEHQEPPPIQPQGGNWWLTPQQQRARARRKAKKETKDAADDS